MKKSDSNDKATVHYSIAAKLNVGNYQSVQVTVGISLECRSTEIDKTYNKILKDVNKKVDIEVARVKQETWG